MQNQNKFVENSQSFAPPPSPPSTELLPLYMCCNIHHFGITKQNVMASKLQVTASIKTTSYANKTTSYANKTTSYAFKIYKFESRH